MSRRLLNVVTALSLLLCVAACVLWVRSYSVLDSGLWLRSPDTDDGSVDLTSFALSTVRGGVGVSRERHRYPAAFLRKDGFEPRAFRERVLKKSRRWAVGPAYKLPHFEFDSASPYAGSRMMRWSGRWPAVEAQWGKHPLQKFDASAQRLAIPYWLVAVATIALPAGRLAPRLWRRLRPKHAPGHCRRCGYDLRATLGRCPECGSIASRGAMP